MHSTKNYFYLVLFLSWFLLLAPQKSISATDTIGIKLPMNTKVAVMPFLQGRPPKNIGNPFEKVLDCSVEKLCILDERFQYGSEKVVMDQFYSALKAGYGERLLPKNIKNESMDLPAFGLEENTLRKQAVFFGKQVGADLVFAGSLWRFRDKGVDSSGEFSPSSVAFAAYLIDVSTGKKVWNGSYDKTQQALSDNILKAKDFLKQGGKWLTAKDLSKVGVQEVLSTFPFSH